MSHNTRYLTEVLILSIVTLAVLLFIKPSNTDTHPHSSYCSSVMDWKEDRDKGINEFDRRGHLNYKKINCEEVLNVQ